MGDAFAIWAASVSGGIVAGALLGFLWLTYADDRRKAKAARLKAIQEDEARLEEHIARMHEGQPVDVTDTGDGRMEDLIRKWEQH